MLCPWELHSFLVKVRYSNFCQKLFTGGGVIMTAKTMHDISEWLIHLFVLYCPVSRSASLDDYLF